MLHRLWGAASSDWHTLMLSSRLCHHLGTCLMTPTRPPMWDNVLGRSPGPINPSTLSLTLLLRALASECGGGTTRIAAPPPGGAPHPAIYSLILLTCVSLQPARRAVLVPGTRLGASPKRGAAWLQISRREQRSMRPSAVSLRERDGRRSNQGWGLVGSQASGEELPFPGACYQTTPISKHGNCFESDGPVPSCVLARRTDMECEARGRHECRGAHHECDCMDIFSSGWDMYLSPLVRLRAHLHRRPVAGVFVAVEGVLSSSGRSRSAALSSIHSSRGAASPRCSFLAVSPSPSPLSLSRACSLSLAALAQLPSPRYTRRVGPLRRAAPFSR